VNEPAPSSKEANGLTALLKGDNASKLLALLILVTSGGNFWQTRSAEAVSRAEFERAFREIHDVHSEVADAMARQKYLEQALRRIEDKLQTK
jgi:hypothetical protein